MKGAGKNGLHVPVLCSMLCGTRLFTACEQQLGTVLWGVNSEEFCSHLDRHLSLTGPRRALKKLAAGALGALGVC